MNFYEKVGKGVIDLAPSIRELNSTTMHDEWFWIRFRRVMKILDDLLDEDRITSLTNLANIEELIGS